MADDSLFLLDASMAALAAPNDINFSFIHHQLAPSAINKDPLDVTFRDGGGK